MISEEDQIVTLLGSLPDSYATMVTAMEAHMGTLTLQYVQQAVISEEQRRGVGGRRQSDTAYQAGH